MAFSNIYFRLKSSAEQLRSLCDDITTIHREIRDPNTVIIPRHSLQVEVEYWVLVTHFLMTLGDWQGLLDRWKIHFGQGEKPAWRRLARDAREVSERLVTKLDVFDAYLRDQWELISPVAAPPDSAEGIFHVWAHAQDVESLAEELRRVPIRENHFAAGFSSVASSMRQRAMAAYREAEQDMKWELAEYLRQYNHSSLRLSYIFERVSGKAAKNINDWEYLERGRGVRIEGRGTAEAKRIIAETLNPILARIQSVLDEIGYDGLLSDLTARDMLDSGIFLPHPGGAAVNVIPSHSKSVGCCPLLIAFSSGLNKKASISFQKIMNAVRTHLIHCHPKTQVVAFICDSWDSAMFASDYCSDLSAWHTKGVEFLFLLVASPNSRPVLSEIDVNLA